MFTGTGGGFPMIIAFGAPQGWMSALGQPPQKLTRTAT